jgi:hypothetical protein
LNTIRENGGWRTGPGGSVALKLNLRNIAKAHTWAEEHFGQPMPGGSQTRMSRTYIRKREIHVSHNQHENHSADFYCVPDRIRGVYNENGFLHFATSEEQSRVFPSNIGG